MSDSLTGALNRINNAEHLRREGFDSGIISLDDALALAREVVRVRELPKPALEKNIQRQVQIIEGLEAENIDLKRLMCLDSKELKNLCSARDHAEAEIASLQKLKDATHADFILRGERITQLEAETRRYQEWAKKAEVERDESERLCRKQLDSLQLEARQYADNSDKWFTLYNQGNAKLESESSALRKSRDEAVAALHIAKDIKICESCLAYNFAEVNAVVKAALAAPENAP